MQKSDSNQMAKSTHRKVGNSTTLNRRYARRPGRNADIMVKTSGSSKQGQQVEMKKMSAKELKDQAIKKALASAEKPMEKENDKKIMQKVLKKSTKGEKMHFGLGRVALALGCAAVAVFAIVYFVNLSMPDFSLKVAAMQTGIDATYPSYVPRDYNLSNITSENGKIVLEFKNYTDDHSYTLTEESSSWDSNALLENYVKSNYEKDYSTVKEQGLTIYMGGRKAAWVNGGVFYEISTSENGLLTKKQITTIANSL